MAETRSEEQPQQQRHVNRIGWPPGPWDSEPDRVGPFVHEGLICFLRRHRWGYWCGYVGVPPDHPFHGWDTDDFQSLPVTMLEDEREITYTGTARNLWPSDEPLLIGSYFIGFSCGDAYDLTPKSMAMLQRFVASLRAEEEPLTHRRVDFPDPRVELLPYRTIEYARGQLERLAELLARIGS